MKSLRFSSDLLSLLEWEKWKKKLCDMRGIRSRWFHNFDDDLLVRLLNCLDFFFVWTASYDRTNEKKCLDIRLWVEISRNQMHILISVCEKSVRDDSQINCKIRWNNFWSRSYEIFVFFLSNSLCSNVDLCRATIPLIENIEAHMNR